MIPFQAFKKDLGKKYVCFNLSDKSQKDLRSWCMVKGFDLTKSFPGDTISPEKFDFHITIFFTNNEVYHKEDTIQITPVQIHLGKMAAFGKNGNTPVFLVSPQNLLQFRMIYKGQGFKDNYPNWKPHVSVSYNWNENPSIVGLEYDGPPLFVDSITVEPVVD